MKNIKNLIVCGDSFQDTGHYTYKGTHWSEIVADRLGLNLVNLAIKGGSSIATAFQLLHGLKLLDSIVVGAIAATETRFEISTEKDSFVLNTIENFIYEPRKTDPWGSMYYKKQHIHSLPLMSLPDELKTGIAMHVNLNLKRQTDLWSILHALGQLRYNKVPFLFFQSVPKSTPIPLENFLPFADESNIIKHADFDLFADIYDHDKMTHEEICELDPGYHTTPERQVVIADYMTKRIQETVA